jgi:hypothetical protein
LLIAHGSSTSISACSPRHGERTLLVACSLACAVTYIAWLFAPSLLASAILIVPVGATSATLYPLASARAYARCPGRSGVVLAGGHLFTPLGLALPWLLGLVPTTPAPSSPSPCSSSSPSASPSAPVHRASRRSARPGMRNDSGGPCGLPPSEL